LRRTTIKAARAAPAQGAAHGMQALGNGAIQRALAQRSSSAPAELEDALAARINNARGRGAALDDNMQQKMGAGLGADFSTVRVHTDGEAHALNEELSARAFTTGPDIFFRAGEYNPHSGSGQELIAHELTHVVQQSSGAVQGSGRMSVNAPGDRFEQQADAVARSIGAAPAPPIQRQAAADEEETIQAQQAEGLEDEEVFAQKQELPEEEEVGTT
jgi:hypothetical protein